MPDASASLTLLTRYVPASTGAQGNRLTSQRGVVPTHWGGVLVVLASCRAAEAPSVWTGSEDSAMSVQFLFVDRGSRRAATYLSEIQGRNDDGVSARVSSSKIRNISVVTVVQS